MANRFTPHLVELTYEAALKSFWRKNALRKFLRSSQVPESVLATWNDSAETKREFLDRLFEKLQTTDQGKATIFTMARNLADRTSFPDLSDWEESDKMVRDARAAVADLKSYLGAQDKEINAEKKKRQARQQAQEEKAKIRRAQGDLDSLRSRLEELHSAIGTQKGGYDFQDWFYDFLDYFEIDNRRPYNTGGRQIDGSLTVDGTTYLVELKFTSDQADATDVDSMKAKVDSKADNTMGIMVSISGYSSTAISEASGPRCLLLLLDAQHAYYSLTGLMPFKDVVLRVRRHAAQTGEAYLGTSDFSG